jgi:hypothetical protein
VVESIASASNVIEKEPPAWQPGRGFESGLIFCEMVTRKYFDDDGVNRINGQWGFETFRKQKVAQHRRCPALVSQQGWIPAFEETWDWDKIEEGGRDFEMGECWKRTRFSTLMRKVSNTWVKEADTLEADKIASAKKGWKQSYEMASSDVGLQRFV